jgi:hypothetical protein
VQVAKLSVKLATSLQLGHIRAARRAKHASFVELALGPATTAAVDVGCHKLLSCLRSVWRYVKWDNFLKEVYWRLTLDALPTAQRMHQPGATCLCDALMPGRQHHFWDCPIAQAVVQSIVEQLPDAWCARSHGLCPLTQQHIWLMSPPAGSRHLHAKLWQVVSLAAINAMDCGRKAANDLQRQLHIQQSSQLQPPLQVQTQPNQTQITQFFQPVALSAAQQQHRQLVLQRRTIVEQQRLQQQHQAKQNMLLQAKQRAVAKFWQLLVDFVILNPCPSQGFDSIPHDHPLVCMDANDMLQLVQLPASGV